MAWRARYFLIGGVALITAVGPIGWQFLGGRGEVLKSDGGPIVTVMDFGPSFPLDPLPSGWRHRKFWTRSPMTMASASRAGCRACASRREACDGGDLGQSAETGDCKYIGGFPHFIADAGDDRVGRWLDERIDLVRVYAEIWKDAAPARLVDVAVFCDSDDPHTASISYLAYVRLERR